MNETFTQFQSQSFLNLETFRKNGSGVKTPVWFVEENGRFYVRTVADSWKVRRIRHNPQVNVVPCKIQGEPLGEWAPGTARQVDDPAREQEINKIFNRKYGLQKRMFDWMGKLRQNPMATLEIEISIG